MSFVCSQCNKEFKSEKGLKQHISKMHSVNNVFTNKIKSSSRHDNIIQVNNNNNNNRETFVCQYCDRRFNTSKSLKQHISMTHPDCCFCKQRFTTREDIWSHTCVTVSSYLEAEKVHDKSVEEIIRQCREMREEINRKHQESLDRAREIIRQRRDIILQDAERLRSQYQQESGISGEQSDNNNTNQPLINNISVPEPNDYEKVLSELASRLNYSDSDTMLNEHNLKCHVCFEPTISKLDKCKHSVCDRCLSRIVERDNRCPICRDKL